MKLTNICVAYNLHKESSNILAKTVSKILEDKNLSVTQFPVSHLKQPVVLDEDIAQKLHLVIIIGGDGTLLAAARYFAPYNVYLLGLNTGRLGFLTEITAPRMIDNNQDLEKEFTEFFDNILAGNYQIDTRSMLTAEINRLYKHNNPDHDLLALNEIAITRSSRSSIINLDLAIDDYHVGNYLADGLVISTPTGSTAYSMAAGGSILAPNIEGLQIVPVCAHSLTNRPLVVCDSSILKVRINSRNIKQSLITLQCDGQDNYLLQPDEEVIIYKSQYKTLLLRSTDKQSNFYNILNKKLLWSVNKLN